MEIAHAQTRVLRGIGKLILLGLLVILLAKVLVALTALAVIGLVVCLGARAAYGRRAFLKRVLFWTKEQLIHSRAVLLHAPALARAGAYRVVLLLLALAELLRIVLIALCALLGYLLRSAFMWLWSLIAELWRILARALTGVYSLARGVATGSLRMLAAGFTMVRSHSVLLLGIFVEAASGALIGVMLGLIPNFLPSGPPMKTRVFGAAVFGAILGIAVGLSRITWAKPGEQSHLLRDEN
ncbi:MAG TPA: hypothetical protein VKU02_23360 [Gemmataceae bacterium]|nr:hypothetical protein [Gemmataceae bacterium]